MLSEIEKKWLLLQHKLQKIQVEKAFEVFRCHKIEPVLIKGLAIARFYPQDHLRHSFDIDLAVSPSDFDKAYSLIRDGKFENINIDLHRGLRHLDTLRWKTIFRRTEQIIFNKIPIRVLSEEDSIRVICVHWLTDGGENKEKLWDIYYSIKNRRKNFDWKMCLDSVDEKRRSWIIYTIGIAKSVLDLDVSDTPIADEITNTPKWLKSELTRVWKRKSPYIPLDACFSDPKMFLYQLSLRFPPNPIMATIGVNGSLNGNSRFFYQMKYFAMRSIPSIKSIIKNTAYTLGFKKPNV